MRRRLSRTIVLWLLPTLLTLGLVGCVQAPSVRLPWEPPAAPAGLILTDLHDLADLQSAFNADVGKPRLVMLVSPT
jgi:hypothetical protein